MTTKIDEKLSNAILTGCDLKASNYRVDHFKFPGFLKLRYNLASTFTSKTNESSRLLTNTSG